MLIGRGFMNPYTFMPHKKTGTHMLAAEIKALRCVISEDNTFCLEWTKFDRNLNYVVSDTMFGCF